MINRKIISTFVLTLVALGLLFFEQRIERQSEREEFERKKDDIQQSAQDFRLKLSLNFAEAVHVLYGLKSYIEANPYFEKEQFDQYAASIKRVKPAIRNIGVAPNLVVRFTYPLKGNEAIIGLDYRKGPVAQRAGVFRAIEEGRPVIAGPVNLIQGGQAFILRIPVYTKNTTGDLENWGIIAAPIDMNTLFSESGIETFVQSHDLAIRGHDGLGAAGKVFYGDKNLFAPQAQSILLEVALENGSWLLAIRPIDGWPTKSPYYLVLRVSFFTVFLIIVGIWITGNGYFRERALSRHRKLVAIRERSEFLEILSHEIRSPLQGILGVQKYLLDNGIVEPMRSIVETAHQSGEYINVLINDYLDLQRAESDNFSINLAPTNIREVIDKSIKILSIGHTSDMVSVNWYVAADVPNSLMLDQAKIRQILMNLLGNALKFTHKGFIILNVSYHDRHKKPSLTLTVEDTGIGVESEALDSLFDRFTRNKGGEESMGSGLGLAIARSLARTMGGDITIESEIGKGSSFMIELPAEIAPVIEIETEDSLQVHDADDAERFKDASILIADDVAINRMLLNAMLSPLTKKITVVADGKEVLGALETENYDIIIMDVQMPNMNGIEATKIIRNNSKYKDIPIVGLTGEETSEQQDELFAAGMNAVLTKPISFEPLLQKLKECYRA